MQTWGIVMMIVMMVLFIVGLPMLTAGGILRPEDPNLCIESEACKKSKKVNAPMIIFGFLMMIIAIILGIVVMFMKDHKSD